MTTQQNLLPDATIGELREQIDRTEARIQRWDAIKQLVLAYAIPLLVLVVIALLFVLTYVSSTSTNSFLTALQEFLFGRGGAGGDERPLYQLILRGWFVIFLILGSAYVTILEWPLYNLRGHLRALLDKLRLARMGDINERSRYLKNELDALTITTPQLFFDNDLRYQTAKGFYKEASAILDNMQSEKLAEAQSMISSIQIICLQVQRERRDQRNSRSFAIGTIVVWVVAVILLFAYAYGFEDMLATQVFFWGAMGSLAMTLYHFFNRGKKKMMSFDEEFRWLVARPVFGIIVGAVAFLVYRTGLMILFNDGQPVMDGQPATDAERIAFIDTPVTYIIVFLAAFSDRFYHSLFERLLERTLNNREEAEEEAAGRVGGAMRQPATESSR